MKNSWQRGRHPFLSKLWRKPHHFDGATTFSIKTFSIMTLSIMAISITIRNCDNQHNDTRHKDIFCLCRLSFMLSVTCKSTILNVVMLSVVMLNVVAPFWNICNAVTTNYFWCQNLTKPAFISIQKGVVSL